MSILEAIKLLRRSVRPYSGWSDKTYGLYHNLRFAYRRFGNKRLTEYSVSLIRVSISDLPRYFGVDC